MTDEADRSVVLSLLQVAFLGKCDDYGQGPWGLPLSSLPDLIADCCESGDYILSTCLDQYCWDVVDSSRKKGTSARAHQIHSSCQDQSTVAQRAEMTVSERFLLS